VADQGQIDDMRHLYIIISWLSERHKATELATVKQQDNRKYSHANNCSIKLEGLAKGKNL